jgi:1-acyl-sn-glycerol-3-phosphate acyltransferase
MKLLRGIYTFYGVLVFTILFAFFFLLFLIPITFKNQYKLVGVFNRWWARFMFFFIALPYNLEYRSKLDSKKQYIFAPNHFSYLDIAALGLNHHNTIFVGKNDMENIPVFGYMYRKLHITVDRAKLKSRYSSMIKTFQALDEGKSLVIFPEGGIITEHDPVMGKFKDGAFRAAIEKQIPIVPVTIPYNWIILPPNEFLLRWKMLKTVFHEPIDTSGLTLGDLEPLKEKVKNIIEVELQKHLSK